MNTPTALIIPLLLALFAPVDVTDAKQPNDPLKIFRGYWKDGDDDQ